MHGVFLYVFLGVSIVCCAKLLSLKFPWSASLIWYDAGLALCLFSPEEVDVGKLLHLLDVSTKCDLFVVEKNPARLLLDECDVMTASVLVLNAKAMR